jgi:hypothetical protein
MSANSESRGHNKLTAIAVSDGHHDQATKNEDNHTMETLFGRKKSHPRMSSVSAQDLRSVPYLQVPRFPSVVQ